VDYLIYFVGGNSRSYVRSSNVKDFPCELRKKCGSAISRWSFVEEEVTHPTHRPHLFLLLFAQNTWRLTSMFPFRCGIPCKAREFESLASQLYIFLATLYHLPHNPGGEYDPGLYASD
jgi:hypothetical protein